MSDFYALEYFINPGKRLYWIYILSSVLLAMVYFIYTKKSTKVITSSKLWFHPSAKLDFYYFFVSYFINILLLIPLIISAKTVAFSVREFLFLQFDFYENHNFSYNQIIFLYTLSLFVFSDFTRYWLHRFLHTIPVLWEFHKVHHSAKVLTPFTFYRVHFVENLLFGIRYSITAGLVTGVFMYFFGAMLSIKMILGVNVILFVFAILGSNLRHSHVPLSYGNVLEKFFISPKQHQIHHSKKHFNKNFGGYLAVWDYLFGSLKLSSEVKVLKFGLRKEQMGDYNSIFKILTKPFFNVITLFFCRRKI